MRLVGRALTDTLVGGRSGGVHYCPLDQAPMYYLRDETREKVESFGGGYVCEQRYG